MPNQEVKVCKYCGKVIKENESSIEEYSKVFDKKSNRYISKMTGYYHEFCADHLRDMVAGLERGD